MGGKGGFPVCGSSFPKQRMNTPTLMDLLPPVVEEFDLLFSNFL